MASNSFYRNGKKYNCEVHGVPYYRKSAVIDSKRRNFYGDGEKDVNNKIEEAKKLAAQGLNLDRTNDKFGQVLRGWLFNIKRIDSRIKASTFTRYEGIYRNYIEKYPIANITLAKLTSITLQKFITQLYEEYGASSASIKNLVKLLKMFTEWAMDEGYITKNPCKNIVIPGKHDSSKKKIEVFTDEERAKLMDYMAETNYQYDTVIKLAFATGMRLGELLGLKWSDIDGDIINIQRSTGMITHVNANGKHERYREVWETKTVNSERSIPIRPTIAQMLREHKLKQSSYLFDQGLPQSQYVFTNLSGELVDQTNFAKSYKRLLERSGIQYRKFHAIRHTFATEAVRRGMDLKDLQQLLGHSDITTTYIYVQSDNNSRRKAIELMGDIV